MKTVSIHLRRSIPDCPFTPCDTLPPDLVVDKPADKPAPVVDYTPPVYTPPDPETPSPVVDKPDSRVTSVADSGVNLADSGGGGGCFISTLFDK